MKTEYDPDIFLQAAELLMLAPDIEFSCNAIVERCPYWGTRYPEAAGLISLRQKETYEWLCRHREYYDLLLTGGRGCLCVGEMTDDLDSDDPELLERRIMCLLWAAEVCNEVEV